MTYPDDVTMARLFDDEPVQWGLRGDPHVWAAMRERLESAPVPDGRAEIERLLVDTFEELVGVDLSGPFDDADRFVVREEFAHGGMSSGMVDLTTWRDRLLPLLMTRAAGARRSSRPTPEQVERAAGVLLGTAVGDVLGVPYEFGVPPGPNERAEMKGGGIANLPPGEWSDDTAMAVAIAEVAATGADLTTAAALDAIAAGFLRWYDSNPPDIGIQTRAVLAATKQRSSEVRGLGDAMQLEASVYAADHPHSAGNGALMRTAPVVLAHLDDRESLARAARLVARLTHADPLAGDSCALWCEAIRVAVLDARIDVRAGLDLLPQARRAQWAAWLDDAHQRGDDPVPGARFRPNGFTVTALQAASAAIVNTPDTSREHVVSALNAAVRIGDDTDTVAAIAGGLLGARWGAEAIPLQWRQDVHGWPGLRAADLVRLARAAVEPPPEPA